MASTYWYGAYQVLDAEMRSGNAKRPTSGDFGSGRMTVPYQMNYNESSTSALWGYAYYSISAVNNVLESIPNIEVNSTVSQQQLDNIKAEALFIRAFCYFDLVRTYAHAYSKGADAMGVPVVLVTDKSAKEQPARNTVGETYDQIVADLIEAEGLMESSYYRSAFSDPKASASLPAIQALLSRVYLNMGEYQKCADYATKVIENKSFSLWSADQIADPAQTWGVDVPTGGEVIFEIYGITSNSYDGYWESVMYLTYPEGSADCAASADLVAIFDDGDVRGTLFTTDANEASGGEMWSTKFPGKGLATPDVNNVIILRLSEMYLNRAEALANGATIDGASALGDLNTIAERCGAASYTTAGNANIQLERRKELAFEGHYWYDLARTQSALSYEDATIKRSLAKDADLWALPIPKRELDVNSNLVQNNY